MKIRIAFATKADGTVDIDRIGNIEDHPDADAKELIKQGIAAPVTDHEVEEWEALEAHKKATAEAKPQEPTSAAVDNKPEEQAPRKMRRNRVSGQLEEDTSDRPIVVATPSAEPSPDVNPAQ